MRKKIVLLYKNGGETPLECLDRFRRDDPEYKEAVLSYVGRLDPMAEGVLLVLVDEENKKREKYLNLDKTYEVDILFGVKTDTGDVLGKLTDSRFVSGKSVIPAKAGTQEFNNLKVRDTNLLGPRRSLSSGFIEDEDDTSDIKNILESFVGDVTLPYPAYSSKPVEGKPLFEWAREGRTGEITIPQKTSKIFAINHLGSYSLDSAQLFKEIVSRIRKVKGDFRQEEILSAWNKMLENQEDAFHVLKIEVSCSSGTYMRSLAEAVAKKLDTVGIAWRIKRTRIGTFQQEGNG